MQLLCFLEKKKIKSFYNKIKQTLNNEKFNKFYNYFNRNWLGKKYPVSLWNFSDLISNKNNIERFQFANNITENINKFLNIQLKRGKYSANVFRDIILTVIAQFENKESNKETNKKKVIY